MARAPGGFCGDSEAIMIMTIIIISVGGLFRPRSLAWGGEKLERA